MRKILALLLCTLFFVSPALAEEIPNFVPKVYVNTGYEEANNPFVKPNPRPFDVYVAKPGEIFRRVPEGVYYNHTVMIPTRNLARVLWADGVRSAIMDDGAYFAIKTDEVTIKYKEDSNIINVNGKNYATLAPCRRVNKYDLLVPLDFTVGKLGGTATYRGLERSDSYNKQASKQSILFEISLQAPKVIEDMHQEDKPSAQLYSPSGNWGISLMRHYGYSTLYLWDSTGLYYPIVDSSGKIKAFWQGESDIVISMERYNKTKKINEPHWYVYNLKTGNVTLYGNQAKAKTMFSALDDKKRLA